MRVRFTAEIVDDDGEVREAPVNVETDVPDIKEFPTPPSFIKCLTDLKGLSLRREIRQQWK